MMEANFEFGALKCVTFSIIQLLMPHASAARMLKVINIFQTMSHDMGNIVYIYNDMHYKVNCKLQANTDICFCTAHTNDIII